MFDSFDVRKVLVIAPIRVAKLSWPDEIQKWDHISDLRYSVAVGTEAERIKALKADADIYLINRENVQWLIEKSGLPFDYDMVVVDELSSFKNHQSKRFKALMKVRPKVHRIVVARLWRQGQKNTVSVIHIMTAKTIDDQIMNALETKDHTQSALIDAVKAEVVMDG